jgi:hypothetical protein
LTARHRRFSYVLEMASENLIACNASFASWWRWPTASHEARPAIV